MRGGARIGRSTHNIRLIASHPHTPDSPNQEQTNPVTYRQISFLKLARLGALVFSIVVFLAVFFPNTRDVVLASVTSFLPGLSPASQVFEQAAPVKKNSQTATLLHAATNVDPNPSRGGGDITVVDNSALAAQSGPDGVGSDIVPNKSQSDQISVYIVRAGDSLSQVAEMFGVSVNTIVWANDLPSNRAIHEGQTLLILPVSGVKYTVKKGDTLKGIASAYSGDVDEILKYNGLADASSIVVGSTITIPGGEVPAAPPPKPSVAQKKASGSGAAPKTAPVSKNVASGGSGYYLNPLPGSIETQGLHGYNAVDLATAYGSPILAAATGEVIVSRSGGWNGGYGNYVVISHANGTQTLYAHMSNVIVSEGQHVVRGQVVGYEGETGKATGPHLHFEVRGAKNPF